MQKVLLSDKEAYLCMFNFLKRYYQAGKSDVLGALLGAMQINKFDDMPMDPAMWSDWLEAIQKFREDSAS